MRKNFFVVFLFSVLLTISLSAVCWAGPSGLVVVRAGDGSLWKATCNGTTCSAFSNFPGNFGSQPTVYWDDDIAKYVLWGRASNSTIWRSTFSSAGVFDNNWVSVPGASADPIGAAGGGIVNNMWTNQAADIAEVWLTNSDVTTIATSWIECPFGGWYTVTGSGTEHLYRNSTTGQKYMYIGVNNSSAMPTVKQWTQSQGGSVGYASHPFSVTRTFACPTDGGAGNGYLVAQRDSNAGDGAITGWGLTFAYYPYEY